MALLVASKSETIWLDICPAGGASFKPAVMSAFLFHMDSETRAKTWIDINDP
jgi:hypothetical protein